MSLCNNAASWIYETILSNLATTYRKSHDYENAIKYYEKALQLNPKNANTYFALAFTYHITNRLEQAAKFYHKSLKYKYDNSFCHEMLGKCLTDASEQSLGNVYPTLSMK